MSTAATVVRRRAPAPKPKRTGWLAALKNEAVSFLKGDNNAPWAILAETVIGCVPVLGQIVDARDIIKGLVEVSGAPASPLAWFNLITALIGLVPGGGDAVKRGLRAVKSKAVPIDQLLAVIRRYYKGDPEALLRKALDLGSLRKLLDDILDNPRLVKQLSPAMRRNVDNIQAQLGKQFTAFKKEIDSWLPKGAKTSAQGAPTAKAKPGTPAAKPKTTARSGSKARGSAGDPATARTPNAATQRTARFKQLSNKVLGVMGEHMADYHCQDVKGWGKKMRHDESGKNSAKLNDGGNLIALWPAIPRGRGIDAVWKSNGAKPYAIIEAKCSFDPTKGLKALLGEAGDKTERGGATAGSSGRGNGGAGRRGSGAGPTAGGIRQTNGKVTQMGHGWIQRRLATISLVSPAAKSALLRDKQRAYTRHVLFFSIPQAVSHAEALIKHTARQQVQHAMHATHQVTREWRDSDIEKVVDNRAGLVDSARKR